MHVLRVGDGRRAARRLLVPERYWHQTRWLVTFALYTVRCVALLKSVAPLEKSDQTKVILFPTGSRASPKVGRKRQNYMDV